MLDLDFAAGVFTQGTGFMLAVFVCLAIFYHSLSFLKKPLSARRKTQAGNVFFTLFGAVAMVGVVGAAGMSVIKGPVRSMHTVTQRTMAENNMITGAKLAVMASATQGDCDGDGKIEPIAFSSTGTGNKPTGGGYIPSTFGAVTEDPWGNTFGYCAWDHGSAIKKTTPAPICPTPANRLNGVAGATGPFLVVISSGPDRVFQTTCANATTYVTKPTGSDDLVLTYTYEEASTFAGDLWNLKSADPTTAEIAKNLEVKNASNTVVFGVDSTTSPTQPAIKVDYIKGLANTSVEYLSNIKLGSVWLSGDGQNEGIRIDSAGKVGIGTASPTEMLHVAGNALASGNITATSNLVTTGRNVYFGSTAFINSDNGQYFIMRSNHATNLRVLFQDNAGNSLGQIYGTAGTDFGLLDRDGNWAMRINTDTANYFYINNILEMSIFPDRIDAESNKIVNVVNPTAAQDGATKSYVDTAAAGVTYTETDPQVGTLTNGLWCRSNGSQVLCDQAAPVSGGNHGARGVKVFTSSGTYSPSSNTTSVIAIVVGGGGAGGNRGQDSDSGSGKAGAPGAPGETRIGRFVVDGSDIAVTVGNGGGAPSGSGQVSEFESITAGRGTGGGTGGNGAGSPGSPGTTQTGSGGSKFMLGTDYGTAGSANPGTAGGKGVVLILEFY